ncbi:MAG TPA: gamma-glutamylcyclotransferase [Thermoanaerobaculia bacterium]|nr:gamma-glutamylcyclotransferase [Thermoanaerobaculia bacterium]
MKAEADDKLVVYGSLAPGERHHDLLAPLHGEWRRCSITGVVRMHDGYRIFSPEGTARIQALMFVSSDLARYWRVLDDFEGDAYRRIVIPVETADGQTVANIYADARNFRTTSEMRS